MFRAMGKKLERVTVLGKPLGRARTEEMPAAMTSTPPAAGARTRSIERREHVLIVTMNRPEARNALSGPMMALMRAGLGPRWTATRHPGLRADRRGRRVLRLGADLKAMSRAHPGDRFGGDWDVVGDRAAAQGRAA